MSTKFKPIPELTPELEAKFWRYVQKSADPEGCWIWIGSPADDANYGAFYFSTVAGKKNYRRAHRVSFKLHHKHIDDNLFVLHRCDNPPCVRGDHLFQGTNYENVQDMVRKDRHCRGERATFSNVVLTAAKVLRIRKLLAQGKLQGRVIAKKFGISEQNVCDIKMRRTWKHI